MTGYLALFAYLALAGAVDVLLSWRDRSRPEPRLTFAEAAARWPGAVGWARCATCGAVARAIRTWPVPGWDYLPRGWTCRVEGAGRAGARDRGWAVVTCAGCAGADGTSQGRPRDVRR